MLSPDEAARNMLAEIQALSESLPTRVPTTLRCGRIVRQMLLSQSKPASRPMPAEGPLFGVTVLTDDSLGVGDWRLDDQWGDELHAGHLWEPGLPVYESTLLPADTWAIVLTPADEQLGPRPCVFVRPEGGDIRG